MQQVSSLADVPCETEVSGSKSVAEVTMVWTDEADRPNATIWQVQQTNI